MAYKTLIPGLVTFDSPRVHMNNMYISSDFSYYSEATEKAKFHYKETVVSKIVAKEKTYDMRSEYLLKEGTLWHYHRPSRFFPLSLTYDTATGTFAYTRQYSHVPFGIGGIFPVGEFIADIINYRLFLEGYVVLRGIAYSYQGKTICITAPGFNGKTRFLDHMLLKGAQYIAEDLLVIDIRNGLVYPTCSFVRRHAWQKKRGLHIPEETIQAIREPRAIDMLYCTENSMRTSYIPISKTFSEFLLVNDRYFLRNRLIRSIVFEEGTWEKILSITTSPIAVPHAFIPIHNFDYAALEKS